jgi:hypothetical protein
MASQNLDLKKLLPLSTRNEMLDSLMSNMFNNFVSEEQSVLVNGRVGKTADGDSNIQAANLDREINALIPALYTKVGSEENIFTFEDILNKLNALDTDTGNLREWMAEQSFNYSLPVNYDKFINYTNYYWIGKELLAGGKIAARAYNPTVEPEFYLISKPAPDDLVKMDVDLATNTATDGYTQLWANGRPPEVFTIAFTSNRTFTVTSDFDGMQNLPGNATPIQIRINNGPLMMVGNLPSIVPTAQTLVTLYASGMDLVSFVVTVGSNHFSSGDVFTLKITYFTSNIVVTLDTINPIGKGAISGSQTVSQMATIDGVRLTGGERILVKDNHDGTDGIYHVYTDRQWERTSDAALDSNLVIDSTVHVLNGTQAGSNWIISSETLNVNPTSSFTKSVNFTYESNFESQINEWQRVNYWLHRDDFADAASLGVTFNKSIRANRPIIEYRNSIEKNLAKDANGRPTVGRNIRQDKTEFNQIPQFNLYRYDGTHQSSSSGLFYYVEDPDYPTDLVLRRRVKTTADYDFIFGMGIKDADGRLLYYKDNGRLVSVWREGVIANTSTQPVIWSGALNKGMLVLDEITSIADNQAWTISAINDTTFSVIGSRSGRLADATVGVPYPGLDPYSTAEVKFTINAGAEPFVYGENFTFIIHTKITPRYVKKNLDGSIVNYPGGVNADFNDGTITGAWMNPARMFENLERETRSEINFGDLLNHTRNVIKNQNGFIGTSYGINNLRTLTFNPGLGGSIREFGSNFPLLASMMIQNDISPLTILDFAEQQYLTALSSIDQFMVNDYPVYLTEKTGVTTTTISPDAVDIQALETYFEDLRTSNILLKNTFTDTSAKVACWPATLPMMGICPAVLPTIVFDNELGLDMIVHHDGHITPVSHRNIDFDMLLVKTQVTRSDGTVAAGIFSDTTPLSPYARQLWYKTSTTRVWMFNVTTDAVSPGTGKDGDIWFIRAIGEFRYWDSIGQTWLTLADQNPLSYWVEISTANIRNSLVLAVENKLFASVHPSMNVSVDIFGATSSAYSKIELAKYSAKYGYDTYVPDYNAADPFTWNYRIKLGQARWFDVYKAYFNGLAATTCRPNLEPWRFGTVSIPPSINKPANWDSTYKSNVQTTGNTTNATVVATDNIPLLSGEIFIDGIVVGAGDIVLVINQSDPIYNGLYTAGVGGWARVAVPIVHGLTVIVADGDKYKGTTWVQTAVDPIYVAPNVDPSSNAPSVITFEQYRLWLSVMWDDVKAYRDIHYPGLKLCVNIYNDELLPPYVSSDNIAGNESLLTVQPSNADIVGYASSYSFGENGPIETAWKKSIEYYYGLARSYFRTNPLKFLDKTWGDTYITVPGNVRVERNLMAPIPANKFLLHGEKLNIINSYLPYEVANRISGLPTPLDLPVAIATTSDILLTGLQKIDGIDVVVNDRVLVKNQIIPADNGIYIVSAGAWTRATDFDQPVQINSSVVYVLGGLSNKLTHWVQTAALTALGDQIAFEYISAYDFEVTYCGDDLTVVSMTSSGTFKSYITVNDLTAPVSIVDKGIPYSLGEKLSVRFTAGVIVYSHTPAIVKKFNGLGQIFTNLLRYNYVDTELSTAVASYRGWAVKLVHRLGAMIRPDTLTINTTQGDLPSTGFNVILKKSIDTQSLWISALRIQLVKQGSRKLNSDGLYVPLSDASDWIFRIESYNPQHPVIDKYTLDDAGEFQTFYALNKVNTDIAWKKFTSKTVLETVTVPVVITGLQNVITYVYGYTDRLDDIGWTINTDFPITDSETGRNINWQLEIEKLINRVYGGMTIGQGHILNPFMDKLSINTPVGLLGKFSESNYIDAYSMQAAYDVYGKVIPVKSLNVIRTDAGTTAYSNTPIFSAHVFIDEYEHVILMNQKFSDEFSSATVFDTFLGLRLNTAYLSFIRQAYANRKPTFNGFFLNGNDVNRNMSSSISTISNYYDASQTFYEPTTARHGLALLGFTHKDYFKAINVNDTTQFNFWRGLIQAKGTNMAIDAFVNYKKFTSASTDEYWAYKIATFGDARERSFPEVKINPTDVVQKFTKLQFYSRDDINYDPLPLFTQIENMDDTRWYSVDDLGKGIHFEATPISEIVDVTIDKFPDIFCHVVAASYPSNPLVDITSSDRYIDGIHLSNNDLVLIKDNATLPNGIYAWSSDGLFYSNTQPTIGQAVYVDDGNTNAQTIWVEGDAGWSQSKLYIRLANIYHNGDVSAPTVTPTGAEIINASLLRVNIPGTYFVNGFTWNNPTKHSPIKLFDYTDNVLIDEISLWHPAIGIHTTEPLEIINIISNEDPAHYDYSTKTTNNPNYRTLKPWGKREVGRVFWDTSNLAYIPYHDATVFADIEARHARWGALSEWASIDLYEWIESNVHPSEYNALAALEEGNSAIDESIRSSGKVAFANYYKRNRAITTRPIAWSYVPTGLANGHPSFEYAVNVNVYKAGNQLIIGEGRANEVGISAGRTFGGWVNNPVTLIGKPVGEVLIDTTISYDIGNSTEPSAPILQLTVSITPIVNGLFGNKIGAVYLSTYSVAGKVMLRMSDSFGFYQDVIVEEPASIDKYKTIPFDTFGLQVNVSNLPSSAAAIVAVVCNITNDIYVRETVTFIETVPLQKSKFVNDGSDISGDSSEWRTWAIPTQAQLDGDLLSPNNSWLPVLGDAVTWAGIANASTIAAMKADSNTMTLKSGVAIKRYASTWTRWESLNQLKIEIISDGVNTLTFTPGGTIDLHRLSIYVNGVQVNPDGYVIDGLTVSLVNKPAEGYVATMLYRAYQPTKDELGFNPDVTDDVSIQVQYKLDYQYTQLDIRNEEGNITSKKYYFWVQDKTIPQANKSMSLVQAKALLKSGPSVFTVFSRLLPDSTVTVQPAAAFDSCAISGLSMYVTKNDSFKLRMLKNFTLLDDPEELSLKNIHTEWVMIRKKQTSKIPAALWAVLTNAVCGTDIGGNLLPSQTRIDYDARNGTRSKFGFGPGQIFADTQLLRTSVTRTLLNTQLTLHLVNKIVPDYITALDFNNSDKWFADATSARITMNLIWNTGRPHQVNEVFFDALEDALANNYEFSDIFKTSLITVNSATTIADSSVQEQADELY